jgi:hypothetical protein
LGFVIDELEEVPVSFENAIFYVSVVVVLFGTLQLKKNYRGIGSDLGLSFNGTDSLHLELVPRPFDGLQGVQ